MPFPVFKPFSSKLSKDATKVSRSSMITKQAAAISGDEALGKYTQKPVSSF